MKGLRRVWLVGLVLLGLAVLLLELSYLLPASDLARRLLMVAGILLLLLTGAYYLYQRARLSSNDSAWWKDDDWTHWGGI